VFELFSIFVNILTPVFALVGVGYVLAPRLQLETRTLSRFAYYVLTPAFLFNILSGAQLPAALALRMALFIITVSTGGIVAAWLIARLLRCPPKVTAAHVLIAAFGNVGNFGLPIIQFKLGDAALAPASFYFLVLSVFGFVIGVMAATWGKGNIASAVLVALRTPSVIAAMVAILVGSIGLTPPLFVQRGVSLLAGAMIPTMLVVLGAQLAGMGAPKLGRDVWLASVVRLIIGPVLALLLVVPFGLTGIERGAGILQASMPAAVLAVLIAMEHDLLPDFVTTAVLLSTLASAFTLTVVLAII
jgi:malate permease and related proteins